MLNGNRVVSPPSPAPTLDLLVAAVRGRTVLAGGLLAGACVFFAPMVVLAIGLLAAYLAYVASDGTQPFLAGGRPLEATDFRAVFAPAITHAPLLVCASVLGGVMAQFRRWVAQRADPGVLAAGARPFFPEFTLLYFLLVALTIMLAATNGGWPQVHRLWGAAPVYLFFMVCATWLAHAVWQYCFRNILDLLSTGGEREAAGELRRQARSPRAYGRRA